MASGRGCTWLASWNGTQGAIPLITSAVYPRAKYRVLAPPSLCQGNQEPPGRQKRVSSDPGPAPLAVWPELNHITSLGVPFLSIKKGTPLQLFGSLCCSQVTPLPGRDQASWCSKATDSKLTLALKLGNEKTVQERFVLIGPAWAADPLRNHVDRSLPSSQSRNLLGAKRTRHWVLTPWQA